MRLKNPSVVQLTAFRTSPIKMWSSKFFVQFLLAGFIFLVANMQIIDNVFDSNALRNQHNISDCPVLYDESCDHKFLNFVLVQPNGDITRLNPLNVQFPENFNKSAPTKILVHGYGGLLVDLSTGNVTIAYITAGYNVILVDWYDISMVPCYVAAFANTLFVGRCLGVLMINLLKLGFKAREFHLIGFSLGAHIVSFASNYLQRHENVTAGRITGLDPALPLFATNAREAKLDQTDASFVDVYHTSSGTFGKLEPIGDIDFYINGGFLQPVCINYTYPLICSHNVVGAYFAESIMGSVNFTGVKCGNFILYTLGFCSLEEKAVMGEYIDNSKRGVYYVTTSDRPPYALG